MEIPSAESHEVEEEVEQVRSSMSAGTGTEAEANDFLLLRGDGPQLIIMGEAMDVPRDTDLSDFRAAAGEEAPCLHRLVLGGL